MFFEIYRFSKISGVSVILTLRTLKHCNGWSHTEERWVSSFVLNSILICQWIRHLWHHSILQTCYWCATITFRPTCTLMWYTCLLVVWLNKPDAALCWLYWEDLQQHSSPTKFSLKRVQLHLYSASVFNSKHHEWSAAPISPSSDRAAFAVNAALVAGVKHWLQGSSPARVEIFCPRTWTFNPSCTRRNLRNPPALFPSQTWTCHCVSENH